MRPYVKNFMVIDDLANRSHECDMLLDQNWFANMETRYKALFQLVALNYWGLNMLSCGRIFEARKSIKNEMGK